MQRIKLSASIMCADLLNLKSDIKVLEQQQFDFLHFDMMDGHFVPEIGFGVFFLEKIHGSLRLPIDVHLMVTDPARYIAPLLEAGASIISFHLESEGDTLSLLRIIRRSGAKAGLALRPETPLAAILPFIEDSDLILLMAYPPGIRNQRGHPDTERRILELSRLLEKKGKKAMDIAVDGGVSQANMTRYREAGASFFILGSSGLFIPGTSLADQAERVSRMLRGASEI